MNLTDCPNCMELVYTNDLRKCPECGEICCVNCFTDLSQLCSNCQEESDVFDD